MTYDTNLAETEQIGLPEFYRLTYGGVIEYYTTWHKNLTFLGNTYKTSALKRSGLTLDNEFNTVKLTIQAPVVDAFSRYIANQPIDPTLVVVYRALATDLTDYVTLFSGRVMSVSIRDRQASATCEANSDVLDFVWPRFMFQSYCNHDLFDTECALGDGDFLVQGAVTISGADLTSAILGTYADGYFTGGRAGYGSDERLITNHVGTTITLHVPFDSRVTVGTTVDFYPGCNGSPSTCKNTFNNYTNFLGFPYIPSKNPVLWGLK